MDTVNTTGQQNVVKLYTIGWIGFASYVGGPLAGAYLMSKNFKSLHNEVAEKSALKFGVISTLLLFGILPFIPVSIIDKIPRFIIPLIYTSIIYSLVRKYQETEINEHIKNNGQKQSGWRATGIAIICLLLTIIYFFVLIMVIPEKMLN